MRPAIRHRHDEPKRTPLPTAEARLSLLESLLVADESEAAQGAVSWVVAQGLARQAVCALVSEDSRLLTGAGGSGVPRSALEELSVELDERDHPLVKALWGVGPVQFPAGSRHPSLAITPPFVAIPLRPRSPSGSPLGLLLVSGEPAPELSWVAEVVAERIGLARIRARAAERRSARDRELLRAAIDAVPDPVLVTDREGAILFANPRARKLLLSSEPDGEERRRAVALNRMLLSVALAGREVEPSEPSRDELLLVDPAEGTDLLLELISVRLDQAAIVSVLRNVTDVGRATQELGESTRQLKAAQDEVAAERHRLELIIASVADPIVVTDSAGDVLMMNPPAERLFTVHPEGATEIQRRVRANDALFSSFLSNLLLMGDRMSWRGEVALADPPTGEPMPVEAVSGKILSSRGELSTVVTILHDRKEALERARLVEQLKTASAELEAKVRGATAELATQNELLRRQAVAVEQASAAKSQFLAN
ncbi:MAG: PAS domain-containing protein, partial [Myxococcales bacterium]|nr:PAS domain-containing protein [Myxococcales bacterium]